MFSKSFRDAPIQFVVVVKKEGLVFILHLFKGTPSNSHDFFSLTVSPSKIGKWDRAR
jgi:hypothetical protein